MINSNTAGLLVETAAETIQRDPAGFRDALDPIPAALYVTDAEGTITYFNPACVPLAGRTPETGRDRWCVTWRLYTSEGEFLPHDQCPMAVAIRERRPVRDAEAIAERPDGTRVHFVPFPTPLYDRDGRFAGAINLLLDVSEQRKPAYLRRQAARCRRLAASCTDQALAETLQRMSAKYDEYSLKLERAAAALSEASTG